MFLRCKQRYQNLGLPQIALEKKMCVFPQIISPNLFKFSCYFFYSFFFFFLNLYSSSGNNNNHCKCSHSIVHSVRFQLVALLVSATACHPKWSREAYSSVSDCCHLRNLQGVGKESNQQGQIQKQFFGPLHMFQCSQRDVKSSFHLPKNHSKTRENIKRILGISAMISLDIIAHYSYENSYLLLFSRII